jgi:hypothetical protein
MTLNMSLLTAYKMLRLGGVWWPRGISWWGLKKRSEAWQENGVWKEEGNTGKIFEDATRLDSWDNQERVEFICVRRWYVGRLVGLYWDGPGVLETEPSTVSSCVALGHIFIMTCYASLLSQDMSYGIGVRQGCSSWMIPCMLRSSGVRLRRKRG